MDSPQIPGKHATGKLYEDSFVLVILGPPDLINNSNGTTKWLYLFDRFANKDWFVLVTFAKNDQFAEFTYNALSTLNVSEWKPYDE
jgi:hypothetical protein